MKFLGTVAGYLSLITIIYSSLNTAFAQSQSEIQLVPGITNDGNRLALVKNSVTYGNFGERVFEYAIVNRQNIKFRKAVTPWCRYGKIFLDKRAEYEKSEISSHPSWLVEEDLKPGEPEANRIYVVANSESALNLLKAVCASPISKNE